MARTDPIGIDGWRDLEYHELCLAFPNLPEKEFQALRDDIVAWGLMEAITLFQGQIIDGKNRHRACMLEDIEPHFETFMGPGSPVDFVLSKNLQRRNLMPAQRLQIAIAMTEWMKKAAKEAQAKGAANLRQGTKSPGPGKFAVTGDDNVVPLRPSDPKDVRHQLATAAGVGDRTAGDFLTITEDGTPEDVTDVVSGKASISTKAKEVRARRPIVERTKPKQAEYITLDAWKGMDRHARTAALTINGKAKLNKQDRQSIGWAKWSWNPVTGCKHNCPYCYARDLAARYYEQGFIPSLIPSRLTAPQNHRPPADSSDQAESNIFTCSMADLFGKWVPEDWIGAVMDSVCRSPEWNFLFLTKFPSRMVDRDVPANAWLGTTVDMQARVAAVEKAFERVPAHTKWLSLEPLIEPLKFTKPEMFKWVVIGGSSRSSQTPEWHPPFEWVTRLYCTFKDAGAAVYIKDNIGFKGPTRPLEYPWRDPEFKSAPEVFHYLKNTGE